MSDNMNCFVCLVIGVFFGIVMGTSIEFRDSNERWQKAALSNGYGYIDQELKFQWNIGEKK